MSTLSDKQFYLLLSHLFFDTPYRAIKVIEICQTHAAFLEKKDEIFNEWVVSEKVKQEYSKVLAQFEPEKIEIELKNKDIQCLFLSDPNYPSLLKEISDPPIVLYAKGNLSCLQNPKLAVVGARNATEYGKQVTEFLVKDLSDYFCIVSGLAKGIDTTAHDTTLQNHGKTIAVFGCGLDTIYPSENQTLAKNILEHNGLLLSEFPLKTQPIAYRFPLRNRIVSGMSMGVLVCEAGDKSGSLITAYSALDQNREVFAVPGPIYAETSKGTHKLIQLGAKLVTQANDIIEEFQQTLHLPFKTSKTLPEKTTPIKKSSTHLDQLTGIEKDIAQLLQNESSDIDHLIQKTQLPIHELLQTLTMLEIKGVIQQEPGKRYGLV